MKLPRTLAAAGVVAAALGFAAAPAQAQQHATRVVTVKTVHTKVVSHHRRGWHAPRCHTEWRHHHRIRVCR